MDRHGVTTALLPSRKHSFTLMEVNPTTCTDFFMRLFLLMVRPKESSEKKTVWITRKGDVLYYSCFNYTSDWLEKEWQKFSEPLSKSKTNGTLDYSIEGNLQNLKFFFLKEVCCISHEPQFWVCLMSLGKSINGQHVFLLVFSGFIYKY